MADEVDCLPDSVSDAGHKRVLEESLAWQQAAGLASFWEMGATHQGAEQDRTYVLAGQMASTGEQLGLAYAAGNEVAIWREFRKKSGPDPAHEMCMRGMAESQCLFVMSTAHAFANVGLKALALDPDLRSEVVRNYGGMKEPGAFEPFSMDRQDWVSMNKRTCEALEATAQASGAAEVVELVKPVVEFGFGTAWRVLDERRGEDFHRWRLQSHGVEGVPRRSPWSSDGTTRMLKIGRPAYDDALGLAEVVAKIGRTAMLDLGRAMEAYREGWTRASAHLGGPVFSG